ncbi:phage holin family protein [Dehalobacter restrictus]|uniref:Holin n=1 Tax=Dehalobacter restrictus TaxID=55583 RepID=A0A857DDW7_9FIRM|nr:phage holin family protein [Dehalobacter restrictus]QGZ99443.1 hypothetical protein GQ588_01560 [Dehalobacter restrictus]
MDYIHQFVNLFDKFKELSVVAWLCAVLVAAATAYGNLIGYDNGTNNAINFIIFLVISDFITRIIAQLILANKTFEKKKKEFFLLSFFRLIIYAHKTKAISSHAFFKGFFVKVLAYTILLAIAQFASCITNISILSSISTIIYGGIILTDIISNLENLIDCGFTQASGFLSIFKKKAIQFEDETEDIVTTDITESNNNER